MFREANCGHANGHGATDYVLKPILSVARAELATVGVHCESHGWMCLSDAATGSLDVRWNRALKTTRFRYMGCWSEKMEDGEVLGHAESRGSVIGAATYR